MKIQQNWIYSADHETGVLIDEKVNPSEPNFFSCIYTHSGSKDITLGVLAEKIEDLLRVKCRLSNYENSSTFETVLYIA